MNYAIITVDTEGHDGNNPIDKLIWGELGNGTFAGIDLIMDIAEEHNTKVLFFVDFAEAWDYGREKIAKVAEHISSRGHDVGMHIHPDHMADKNRMFLWEYSKEEQRNIITKCTNLYLEILKSRPIAFRAGKYSANYDTLDIINDLGYKYDFSLFMGQKWCGIKPEFTADKPCRYKNLIEVPVTSFLASDTIWLKRFDKLDMEMVYSQFKYITKELSKYHGYIISLFLHSFSLIRWRHDPNNPKLWKNNIIKYKKCLTLIDNNPNITILTLSELDRLITNNSLLIHNEGNKKPIVRIKNWIRAYYYLLCTSLRIAEHNQKARMFILLNFSIFVLLALLALKQNIFT